MTRQKISLLKPSKASYSYIRHASVIYHSDSFYVFGGYARKDGTYFDSNVIARMTMQGSWSISGQLNTARRGHGIIFDGEYVLVIGGVSGSPKVEKCLLEDGVVMCTEQDPALTDYYYYPELYLVPDSYCK